MCQIRNWNFENDNFLTVFVTYTHNKQRAANHPCHFITTINFRSNTERITKLLKNLHLQQTPTFRLKVTYFFLQLKQ